MKTQTKEKIYIGVIIFFIGLSAQFYYTYQYQPAHQIQVYYNQNHALNDEIINEKTEWKAYEFKYKPGDPYRKLPIIAPYQPRIDWQIWFAAFSSPEREPWLIHFVWKLLHNDKDTLSLIANNPFPNESPKYIKIEFYKYEFAKPGTGKVWERIYVGQWLPPISTETKGLRGFIKGNRWELYE